MGLLARQVAAIAAQKRLSRQRSSHSSFVAILRRHSLFQQAAE
jgi:hypothetical protein